MTLMKKLSAGLATCSLALVMTGGAISPANASEILEEHRNNYLTNQENKSLTDRAEHIYVSLEESESPLDAYHQLNDDDRKFFDDYFFNIKNETVDNAGVSLENSTMLRAAGGCWTRSHREVGTNSFGIAAYDVIVEGRWCVSGGQFTSVEVLNHHSEIGMKGYREISSESHADIFTDTVARMIANHRFTFGIPELATVGEAGLCSRVSGYKNGIHGGDSKCHISEA